MAHVSRIATGKLRSLVFVVHEEDKGYLSTTVTEVTEKRSYISFKKCVTCFLLPFGFSSWLLTQLQTLGLLLMTAPSFTL